MVPTTPTTAGISTGGDCGSNTASGGSAAVIEAHSSKNRASGKLDYLDGLRGYAALTVMIDHFLFFFMPTYFASLAWPGLTALAPQMYNGQYRLPSNAEGLLFPFMDGQFSVAIFFVLSGRVLMVRSVDAPFGHGCLMGGMGR
jgi:hypothetical protein